MAAIGSSSSISYVNPRESLFGLGEGIFSLPTDMIHLILKSFVDAVSTVTFAFTCKEIKQFVHPDLAKSKFCKKAAELGYLRLIQWGINHNCRWTPSASGAAAKAGQMDVLRWAWDRGCLGFEKTALKAAKGDQPDVLAWLFERGAVPQKSMAYSAASAGHIELYQALRFKLPNENMRVNQQVINSLIESENLDALIFFRESEVDLYDSEADGITYINLAADKGNLEIFKFFVSLGLKVDRNAIESAARSGHINILEYILFELRKRDLFDSEKSLCSYYAAYADQWHVIHWLISQNIKGSSDVAEIAAGQNLVEELELLEKAGWPFSYKACEKAAKNGHWDLVEKLIEKGHACSGFYLYISAAGQKRVDLLEKIKEKNLPMWKWNELSDDDIVYTLGTLITKRKYGVAMAAASGGDVKTLRWVKHNGFEWQDESVSTSAAAGGLAALEWLLQRDCPYRSESLYTAAAQYKHVDVIEWLSGFPLETRNAKIGVCVAEAGRGDLLIRLRQKGCPVTATTMAAAAKAGHWDIVHWLMATNCPWDERVIEAAAQQDKVEFLDDHIFKPIRGHSLISGGLSHWYMGFIAKLELLADHGYWEIFKLVVTDYVSQGEVNVLRWVKEQGYGFDVKAVTQAAQVLDKGYNVPLEWLQWNNSLDAEKSSF